MSAPPPYFKHICVVSSNVVFPEGVSIRTCAACVCKVFPCGHVLNVLKCVPCVSIDWRRPVTVTLRHGCLPALTHLDVADLLMYET
jgi:hypothetical protein